MPNRIVPKLLDLAILQALASEGGYAGRFTLSDESALVALSSALWLENLDIWQGVGYDLTDEEIDQIQALTAELQFELMVGGSVMYKCSLTRTTNQTIPNAVNTGMLWDSEVYDPDDMHDLVTQPARMTIVRDGLYAITASVAWVANATGMRQMFLVKVPADASPATIPGSAQRSIVAVASREVLSINTQLELLKDDYLYVTVYQNSGASLNVKLMQYSPYFQAVRL